MTTRMGRVEWKFMWEMDSFNRISTDRMNIIRLNFSEGFLCKVVLTHMTNDLALKRSWYTKSGSVDMYVIIVFRNRFNWFYRK